MSHRHRGYVGAVLGGVLAAALLAACANVGTSPRAPARGLVPSTGTVLDQKLPSELESLHLVDQRGRTFTLASLRGKTVVLADFLTLCQEVCPLTSVNLRDVVTAVAHRGLGGQVVVVEATVDPKRDTAAALAAYEQLYGHHDGWILATGDPLALDTLWSRLGVYHAVDEART